MATISPASWALTDEHRIGGVVEATLFASMGDLIGIERLSFDDEDVAGDNTLRARWAAEAVGTFAARTMNGGAGEAAHMVISDLLADVMHLCDVIGADFASLVERGRTHYDAELRGEL